MMTAADLIYGVTMQEPGVSKLVSVRLAEETNQGRGRERERRLATA
jgi:chromosome segregation protein